MPTAEELRRQREETSSFSRLFDYVRENEAALAAEGRRPVLGGLLSKEPVMGVDTIRYEGIGPMIAGLLDPVARGIDAPRAAAQGLIPAEDMAGEAFGTAGTATLGGGVVAKPKGALGANTLRGGVASDVENRGDTVLNMLKSGRGSDVTDEMLDMGDSVKNTQLNQYLFENYDLPMDEASRMARAREMGYGGGLLHGTGSDIGRVETSRLGEKQNVLGKGFYQTTSPKRAERYVPKEVDANGERVFAEGGNVIPLMTKSADEFDLTAQTGKENITRIAKAFEGSDFDVELRDGGDTAFIRSKSDPNFNVFLDSYMEGQNTLMRLKDAFGNNNLTPILQDAGFTGVKGVESRGHNVRVNYNPEDVRSRFARFDPRLSHLSNLNAANASPTAGLLSQVGMSERQAERTEQNLQRMGLLD